MPVPTPSGVSVISIGMLKPRRDQVVAWRGPMLDRAWARSRSLLCVGLDPEPARFPGSLAGNASHTFQFCREIVDATKDLVCAYKPQIAYFAAIGAERELEELCSHIRTNHPDVVLILDAKRGDIGDTAALYAREAFERYGGRSKLPSLWFYGDNDSYFPPEVWKELQARYAAAGGKARLVAFGRFGEERGINPAVWKLVTGDANQIYGLARQSYFADDSRLEDQPSGAEDFLHTEKALLVDQQGRIRGVYNATVPHDIENLIADIGVLGR